VGVEFKQAIPVFRIFSVEKAREFYLDFLGFTVEWEHRFDPDAPLYMCVTRGALSFHLSEHHGDGTPGSRAYILASGLAEFHRELTGKAYKYNRPSLDRQPWGMLEVTVVDPFNNRITFAEPDGTASA